jgi:hypothetical protein
MHLFGDVYPLTENIQNRKYASFYLDPVIEIATEIGPPPLALSFQRKPINCLQKSMKAATSVP